MLFLFPRIAAGTTIRLILPIKKIIFDTVYSPDSSDCFLFHLYLSFFFQFSICALSVHKCFFVKLEMKTFRTWNPIRQLTLTKKIILHSSSKEGPQDPMFPMLASGDPTFDMPHRLELFFWGLNIKFVSNHYSETNSIILRTKVA